jgi:hypothetical protein
VWRSAVYSWPCRLGGTDAEGVSAGWRKRVGVEPTILAAKDRINGFEGHEDHRTPFASIYDKANRLRDLVDVRNLPRFGIFVWCYWGAIQILNPGHSLMEIGDRQMSVATGHGQPFMAQ